MKTDLSSDKPPVPLVATVLVLLAVAMMVSLGLWQLDRAREKQRVLAIYAANQNKPAMSYPMVGTDIETVLFRKAQANCLGVVSWLTEAGRGTDGRAGWRHIAACRMGAEGPGFHADMGVSETLNQPEWNGGQVTGILTQMPSHASLLGRLFGPKEVPALLLVAQSAAPGLQPSAPPGPQDVPNNHLAYAVQWFLFAGTAIVIYLLVLKKRRASRHI